MANISELIFWEGEPSIEEEGGGELKDISSS
jgi:hypothetical protein